MIARIFARLAAEPDKVGHETFPTIVPIASMLGTSKPDGYLIVFEVFCHVIRPAASM
jgi:hypothetical protein